MEELGEYFAMIANGIGGVSEYNNSADQELPTSQPFRFKKLEVKEVEKKTS